MIPLSQDQKQKCLANSSVLSERLFVDRVTSTGFFCRKTAGKNVVLFYVGGILGVVCTLLIDEFSSCARS